MEINCTTELEAVNLALESIGEQPVNSLSFSGVTEGYLAYQILKRKARVIQGKGLHCNSDKRYPFVPDENQEINVPTNVLRIDSSSRVNDVVRRGGKLWDRDNHTFKFTQDKLECDVVWFLDFQDLPEHVRHYIAVRAARSFQRSFLGSEVHDRLTATDEQEALVEFKRGELRSSDSTILDNGTPYNILNRRR